jgi:hypothetical protein
MYMAAGSGIPETKTIFSGSSIPHFLDFKVLLIKAAGETFTVPFVRRVPGIWWPAYFQNIETIGVK